MLRISRDWENCADKSNVLDHNKQKKIPLKNRKFKRPKRKNYHGSGQLSP